MLEKNKASLDLTTRGKREEYLYDYNELLKKLREFYPKAFPADGCLVLKKGIDLDICKDNKLKVNRTRLRSLLKKYIMSRAYLLAHKVGEPKYNLDGQVDSKVTESEAAGLLKAHRLNEKKRAILALALEKQTKQQKEHLD